MVLYFSVIRDHIHELRIICRLMKLMKQRDYASNNVLRSKAEKTKEVGGLPEFIYWILSSHQTSHNNLTMRFFELLHVLVAREPERKLSLVFFFGNISDKKCEPTKSNRLTIKTSSS